MTRNFTIVFGWQSSRKTKSKRLRRLRQQTTASLCTFTANVHKFLSRKKFTSLHMLYTMYITFQPEAGKHQEILHTFAFLREPSQLSQLTCPVPLPISRSPCERLDKIRDDKSGNLVIRQFFGPLDRDGDICHGYAGAAPASQ